MQWPDLTMHLTMPLPLQGFEVASACTPAALASKRIMPNTNEMGWQITSQQAPRVHSEG
jgi:hypothetical protein